MDLIPENIYHIYNRGNNGQHIFFTKANCSFFLKKISKHILPHVSLFAYCLMPNHFHLMVYTPEDFNPDEFHASFKITLSSYTRAINVQEQRTGSLFQQHSKAKCISKNEYNDSNVPLLCLNYIHLNPVSANLVRKPENWEFSSMKDYLGKRSSTICDLENARCIIGLPNEPELFYQLTCSSSKSVENIMFL